MTQTRTTRANEQGYMLAVLMFAVALTIIALAIAAPRLARSIQLDREHETARRAEQYVRAVQLYYRKFGTYPTSVDQLVSSNNMRFLRQKYIDPMTGKDDWKLIHLGQNKTQSTGFFGKPLSGVGTAGGGLGGGIGSNTASSFSTSGGTGGLGSSGLGSSSNTAGTPGGTSSLGGGISSQSATGFSGGGGGPIIGVSPVDPAQSMMEVHDKDHYSDWEFFYDPLVDQMKAAAMAAGGGGSVGSIGSNTASTFSTSSGTSTGGSSDGSSNIFGSSSFGSSNGSTSSGTTTGSPTTNGGTQQ